MAGLNDDTSTDKSTGLVTIPKNLGNGVTWHHHFFNESFCGSRTLLGRNAFRVSVSVSYECKATASAIQSLCALYLGEQKQYEEQRYLAVTQLRKNGGFLDDRCWEKIFLPLLLLLQASILDITAHKDWEGLLKVARFPVLTAASFPETLQYRMKVASHAILSNASAIRGNDLPRFDFLSEEEQSIGGIDSLTGLSPELMFILQTSNDLHFRDPKDKADRAMGLIQRVTDMKQEVTEADIDESLRAKRTAEFYARVTAETYRLAAMLYIYCRVLGREACHTSLAGTQEALLGLLETLPCSGEHYKAIWPLYPLFILSVVHGSQDRRKRLGHIWDLQDQVSPRSNIAPALAAARTLLAGGENLDWDSSISCCSRVSLT